MQKETIKFTDSVLFEGMTSIRAVLAANDEGINDRRITEILYDGERAGHMHRELGYLKAIAEQRGFVVRAAASQQIDALTLGTTHGGLIARVSDRTLPRLADAVASGQIRRRGFYTMIEGIEDPYNFGYAIRSLYACGCHGIIVAGRNWFSAAGVVARSSAGASERIRVFAADTAMDAVQSFHSLGYTVVCAEEKTENILGRTSLPLPLLLVVGGERRGMSKGVIQAADIRVKIDYARPFRASLSAASATTMFAYEIARQNTITDEIE